MRAGREDILWWAGLRPPEAVAEPPSRADVAIVGGGYTGLAAARALARCGTRVVVLERDHIGFGASGRNGGMVLPGYKAEPSDLVRRHGMRVARRLFEDSLSAIDFVESLIQEEAIECDWGRPGHVTLAARPSHFRELEAARRLLQREFGYETGLIGPTEMASEIGSGRYHGGLIDLKAGSLQPARYVSGLAKAAMRAGAMVCERTGVSSLNEAGGVVRLGTNRGSLEAAAVLIATNGYTGRLDPWLARRVVPVGSYIIATEPLAPEVQRRLVPRGRMLSDTKNLLYYFRLSPDGRMVFGGRAAFVPTALARSREMLRQGLTEVFPELSSVRTEYAWGGTLGFARDLMPHAGRRGAIVYALGYGGHGVALASWLGDRIGRVMAGQAAWPALGELPFPSIPLYRGRPWFLPLAGAYYGLRDRIG
jgi:glycine/D-amino acid oxidase-like deaminating enzyme